MRYPALIDHEPGLYGVTFPDLPGCVAVGTTVDQALLNAEAALRDWIDVTEAHGETVPVPSALEDVDVPSGSILSSILLVHSAPEKRSVRLNLSLDANIADLIASEAQRRGMSRKQYLEWMVHQTARAGL